MLKTMYSVFLGLITVMFVGVGVETFYPTPEAPDEPVELVEFEGETETAEQKQIRETYEADQAVYDDKYADYNRNVAIILMVSAVVLLYLGMSKFESLAGISEGLLLGGIFTLFYSLIRGLMSEDDVVRFMMLAIGLVIAVFIGKRSFDKPASKEQSNS